jgi:hypothetical protein
MPIIPSMTKCHFEFIAETIERAPLSPFTRGKIAAAFAGRLSMTNERFSTETFMHACGVTDDNVTD